jgi:hypothetical protein
MREDEETKQRRAELVEQRDGSIRRLAHVTQQRADVIGQRADRMEDRAQLQARSSAGTVDEETSKQLAKVDDAINQADGRLEEIDAFIVSENELMALLNRQMRERATLIQRWYKYSLGILVIVGLYGEIWALVGGLRLWPDSYQIPVFMSTLAILWMLCLMAQGAWLRIGPEFSIKTDGKPGKSTGVAGTLTIATIAVVGMILLSFAVYG